MGMGRAYVHDKRSKKNNGLFFSFISFPFVILFEIAKFIVSAPFILLFGSGKKKKRR